MINLFANNNLMARLRRAIFTRHHCCQKICSTSVRRKERFHKLQKPGSQKIHIAFIKKNMNSKK